MCRSTDIRGYNFYDRDHHRLKIQGFYVRFSIFKSCCRPLPESLTLAYLPRINGSFLEIDGAKVRLDATAFVTLHRVVLAGSSGIVVFASRERVRASEGVRFEVFLGEEKVLKGIFRKDEDNEWNMECKCGLESEMAAAAVEVTEAEVCVAVEGHVAMSEKVEMVMKRKKKANKCFQRLEEIPEEREGEEVAESDESSDGYDCCCSCGEEGDQSGSDGGGDDKGSEEMEMEMEGVRWAVDVGILVMSLGLGYLVSKASSKSFRRRRIL